MAVCFFKPRRDVSWEVSLMCDSKIDIHTYIYIYITHTHTHTHKHNHSKYPRSQEWHHLITLQHICCTAFIRSKTKVPDIQDVNMGVTLSSVYHSPQDTDTTLAYKRKMPLFQRDLKIKHKFWHYIPVPILFQNACIKSVSFLIAIFYRTMVLEKTLESPLDCNGEGQGSLACCSPVGCKESDVT